MYLQVYKVTEKKGAGGGCTMDVTSTLLSFVALSTCLLAAFWPCLGLIHIIYLKRYNRAFSTLGFRAVDCQAAFDALECYTHSCIYKHCRHTHSWPLERF
jgi:hypothetical protein